MTEYLVKDFFIEKHRAAGLDFDTDLFSGVFIDSLFAFEMVSYLEETFAIRIPDSEINENNFRTIRLIADMIRRIKGE